MKRCTYLFVKSKTHVFFLAAFDYVFALIIDLQGNMYGNMQQQRCNGV